MANRRGGDPELATQQQVLLRSACERLAPQGRVVYSTCSIEPEENETIVRTILGERPDLTLVAERHHIPGRPADGGYQAFCGEPAIPLRNPLATQFELRPPKLTD